MQNFLVIMLLKFGQEQNEIPIKFKLWLKIVSEMGPYCLLDQDIRL